MKIVWIITVLFILSGCMAGRDYQPPNYDVDSDWDVFNEHEIDASDLTRANERGLLTDWWTWFGDEQLVLLVDQTLKNNRDLKRARARIKEAKANERLSRSSLYPQVNATANARRQTLGGFSGDRLDTNGQYGVNGDWEIDLAGGKQRQLEAAKYATEASKAERDQIRLSLISEVTRNYIRLRGLQKQHQLVLRNLQIQQNGLDITLAQREEKMVSQLNVVRARAQVLRTSARLPQIRAETTAAINRLAVLTAGKPGALRTMLANPAPIPNLSENVPLSLPLHTIANRPDVRTAERQLAQSTALSGAAFAEFFPKISLGGFFGRSRADAFGGLSPWSAGVEALLPLFNFGRIQAGVDVADAREEQAYQAFEQSILLAVEDVETNLSSYLNEKERMKDLQLVARDQTEAAVIASEQYKVGIAPQLDLLDAQRSALDAQTELVVSQTLVAQNLTQLLAALSDGKDKDAQDQDTDEPTVNVPRLYPSLP